jgi:hypothetical protein
MPTLADINLDTLRPPGNPADFVVLERPMFKEHWTRESRDEDGAVSSESTYLGRDELKGIADRCNERIADTGDFAPIIINHTTDDGQVENEIIGFSGPYRVGTFGNLHPKATIYGKMWVFKGKEEKLRQFPRLSVEYWCSEENPADGYFDPVSLLGARTPELDLGVHYSKDATGRRLMRYSKEERFRYEAGSAGVYPGGGNTSVPKLTGDDDKPNQYSKESAGMATTLTPVDIQQIVAALIPVITQQVSEAVAGMKVMNANDEGMGGDGMDGMEGDLDAMGGEGDGMDDDLGLDLEGDSDLDIGDDLDGMDMEGDDELGDMDSDGDADMADMPDLDGDDADLDGDGDADLPEIDDEDSDFGLDDDTDLEGMNEPPGGDVADEPEDDDLDLEASGADEGEEMANAPAKKPDDKKKPVKFSKQPAPGMTLQQYAKENQQLRQRYEKTTLELRSTKEELATVKSKVDAAESEKKKVLRYSKLDGLRLQGLVINVDEELADTEPLNDEQFDKHCTKIVERYAKAPIGRPLYVPPAEKRDGTSRDEKVQRYAKVAAEVALDQQKKTGKPVDYAAIRANVERNDGKYVPATA